jgi:hypothetical protein
MEQELDVLAVVVGTGGGGALADLLLVLGVPGVDATQDAQAPACVFVCVYVWVCEEV